MKFLKYFLNDNGATARLARTAAQGLIGYLIANVDTIVESLDFSPETKALITVLVMGILSPVMKELGKLVKEND